jgi:hypothetical protein
MPERFSKPSSSGHPNRDQGGDERPKDPLAVELGRRGGRKGGLKRAEMQTAAERSALARRAAAARWERRADAYVENDDGRKTSRGRLNERLRQAFAAGAEEQSRQSRGRSLSDDELQQIHDRYPGNLEGDE